MMNYTGTTHPPTCIVETDEIGSNESTLDKLGTRGSWRHASHQDFLKNTLAI